MATERPETSRPAPTLATIRSESGGPAWASLTRAQQDALAPLQRDWPGIDASRKAKWLEVASRFPTMPAEERKRVQERMAEWARLSPVERGRARLQFQESRQISAEDRQARWDAYQALPEDVRRELAQRAKTPPPAAAKASGAAVAGNNKPAANGSPITAKRNTIQATGTPPSKPVSPTVVQAKPGATTTLMSSRSTPPLHQQSGLPKIVATEGFVNPATLLPKRGPQGAAVRAAAASEPSTHP